MDSIKTQRLTREQIAAVVGNNPRAIKLFESLVLDVSQTLPDATVAAQETADTALTRAFSQPKQSPQKFTAGDGILIYSDVVGHTVSVDPGYIAGLSMSLAPRQTQPASANDAQAIIAARVFSR